MLQGVSVEMQNGFLSKPIEPVEEIESDTSDSIWVQPALVQDRSDDGDCSKSTVSEDYAAVDQSYNFRQIGSLSVGGNDDDGAESTRMKVEFPAPFPDGVVPTVFCQVEGEANQEYGGVLDVTVIRDSVTNVGFEVNVGCIGDHKAWGKHWLLNWVAINSNTQTIQVDTVEMVDDRTTIVENFTPELRQFWDSVENNGGLYYNSDAAPNSFNHLDAGRCSKYVAEKRRPGLRQSWNCVENNGGLDLNSDTAPNPLNPNTPTFAEKRHSILTVDDVNVLSGSLILALERTLFSALNNAYTITFVGTGLMMVGASNDSIPDSLGIIIVICGLIFACASWVMHYARLRAFQRGASLDAKFSLVWTFFMTFFLFGAVAIELRYGILYPYLKRSKAVEVV